MKPKKYKEIYKEIAEDLDADKNFISACIDFYYRDLRSTLTELNYISINAPGLGVFNIKIKAVNKEINRCKKIIKNKDVYTFNSFQYFKYKESLLEKLHGVKDKYYEEVNRKKEFKNKKNVQSKRNLEE